MTQQTMFGVQPARREPPNFQPERPVRVSDEERRKDRETFNNVHKRLSSPSIPGTDPGLAAWERQMQAAKGGRGYGR